MEIVIICSKCGRRYKFEHANTGVFGPVVNSTCPFCGNKVQTNISKFAEIQTKNFNGRFDKINKMIVYARTLERKMGG